MALSHEPLNSSNLQSVAYDPGTQTLEVKFRKTGLVYRYQGVPAHIATHLRSASSPGAYLHSTIKGYYPAERVQGS